MRILLVPLIISVGIVPAFASNHEIPSPYQQIKNGIEPKDVICKSGMNLLIRPSGDPLCLKPETFEKLQERLWISNGPLIEKFEGCVSAGNLVTESYPRQCKTFDGKYFTERISPLDVKIISEKQVRRGTTHNLEVQVFRGEIPIEGARVFIDIEDYGENIIKEFNGYTNPQGSFILSWEIPKRFDDIETLLAFVDVADKNSSKTVLFKFHVYYLPGEKGCKVEGN